MAMRKGTFHQVNHKGRLLYWAALVHLVFISITFPSIGSANSIQSDDGLDVTSGGSSLGTLPV